MIKYIFRNYDQFLEYIRSHTISMFNSKNRKINTPSLHLKPIEVIEQKIKKQEENLKQKELLEHKLEILKSIIYLRLKKKALQSTSKYIKRAEYILKEDIDDTAYEAIEYLKRVPKNRLSNSELKDIYTYKALIYELIEEYEEASNTYKEALKYDKTPKTLTEYREFVERSREALMWQNHIDSQNLKYNTSNIHNLASLEDLPKIAKRLETIAKYYAKSPKSRPLAKKYFKEVLKIYKKLSKHNPTTYSCIYIDALIDAVEIFMMSPLLLKKAQELLVSTTECRDAKIYLIERINDLKQKGYIKKILINLP